VVVSVLSRVFRRLFNALVLASEFWAFRNLTMVNRKPILVRVFWFLDCFFKLLENFLLHSLRILQLVQQLFFLPLQLWNMLINMLNLFLLWLNSNRVVILRSLQAHIVKSFQILSDSIFFLLHYIVFLLVLVDNSFLKVLFYLLILELLFFDLMEIHIVFDQDFSFSKLLYLIALLSNERVALTRFIDLDFF